ncbi:TetR/AcrR family transcriptional regulator [Nocardia asteroides]|uniref:TetR/AcrR family transcriptional regulator n=1 Tax=Nocardia asteroides TaxID=1824 RepID=UPI001E2E3515|nr:TetR/AcrR family transcriptional regulator [Nocardia asteroides]UGT52839.1 TetR/AcrR family transcriptional regulator [Nocardia asteroides]
MEHTVGAARTPRARWIEEGLQVLAADGVDAVRVEVLAKRIGVTKGGFYGYFADRDALLLALLDTWESEAVDQVLAQVEHFDEDPKTKARLAGLLTFSSNRLLPIDLAIRAWARRDEAVAERLRRVDNRRMALLRETIGEFCDDPDEVEARSLLAFCAVIGGHFLAADHEGRTRLEVLTKAADLLFAPPDRQSLR